jgi:hypothetical protein
LCPPDNLETARLTALALPTRAGGLPLVAWRHRQ